MIEMMMETQIEFDKVKNVKRRNYFSIVFDTVGNRKIRHDMGRKYTQETIFTEE